MTDATEPRWLTPAQQKAWIALLSMTITLPVALDNQLRRDAGISMVEYDVLSWLSMNPDRMGRMSEIAALAKVSLSHLSRIADRLERRGWILREPDPADGRATRTRLTDAGWDKVVATAPGHVAEVQRLVFDRLSATDVGHLRRIGNTIAQATVEPIAPATVEH